ncbi:MAG: sulfurtransferase TusA family protein [Chromatiales bacterium]
MTEPVATTCDVELDTSGLNCPLPVLKTKKALNNMRSGQLLHVIATDPASQIDFEAFCAQTGHTLVEERQEADKFYFVLRRK